MKQQTRQKSSASAKNALRKVNFARFSPNPMRQDASVDRAQISKLTEIVSVPYGHTYN